MLDAAGPDPDAARVVAPIASILARLLTDLGLTTKGRPSGHDQGQEVSWLDELRAKRAPAEGRPAKGRHA
jgi:hypothetical protein